MRYNNNRSYSISKQAGFLSVYLFAFLFLALYGRQGFQTFNQIILWGFGPLLAFYILEPNFSKLQTIPKEYYFYLSMILFALIGYINVIDEPAFYRYLQVFFANFILMIIIFFAINNVKEWELTWKVIAAVGLIISLLSYFIEAPSSQTDEYYRLEGLTGNANGTANYARVAIVASLFLLELSEKKFMKILLWGVILFLSYTILLTASRGGFANLVFILGGYIAFKNFHGWRLIVLLVILFLFGNIILYLGEEFLSDFYLFDRLTRNDSVTDAFDDESRLKLYAVAWKYFIDNPFLGVGLNQFQVYSGGKITHTDILDILVQLGIFAGIVYVSIYANLYIRIMKLKKLFSSPKDVSIFRLSLLCLVSEILFGLGNPNWFTQLQMVVLSLLIVYAAKIRNTSVLRV